VLLLLLVLLAVLLPSPWLFPCTLRTALQEWLQVGPLAPAQRLLLPHLVQCWALALYWQLGLC
jgi:hypothetical protein